jgi:hypothetical protein
MNQLLKEGLELLEKIVAMEQAYLDDVNTPDDQKFPSQHQIDKIKDVIKAASEHKTN